PITNASLLKLTTLDASSCSISDVSALFPLPLLLSIDLSSNKIWAGTGSQSTLAANFVKHSDTNFALDISSQDSECSLSIDAFTANKVCSSTTPTSTHWYVVCASDSFATYTSSSSFSCSRAFA
ncbi:hypothetical protein ADUPG1_004008, partial [Aduncisulcus paluster]